MKAVEVTDYTIKPEAGLEEAKADEDTPWPDGFDPVAAGVVGPGWIAPGKDPFRGLRRV